MNNNVLPTIQNSQVVNFPEDRWLEDEQAPKVVEKADIIQQRAIYRLLVLLRANIGTIASNGFLKMLPRPDGVQVVVNIKDQITGYIVFNGSRIQFYTGSPLNMASIAPVSRAVTRRYPFPGDA